VARWRGSAASSWPFSAAFVIANESNVTVAAR
jgi:hypothetical protein